MHSIYRLNVRELNQGFIDGLKATYQDKEIEIVVYEVDETAYLMGSAVNQKKLLQAVDAVKNRSNLIEVDIENL
jgi:antitoxin YefM